jgi:hypothetical protein
MNNHSDQQRLLEDVLAESSPADFRGRLLAETLRLARRRRRWRQTRSVAGALAVAILAALLIRLSWPERRSTPPQQAKTPDTTGFRTVETEPLPASAVVFTGGFSPVKMVSSASTVTQVATTSGGFRPINDDQLLTLVGPWSAVLIRTGPKSEELVFSNPEDQKRFLGN